jgi:hypothetical protein
LEITLPIEKRNIGSAEKFGNMEVDASETIVRLKNGMNQNYWVFSIFGIDIIIPSLPYDRIVDKHMGYYRGCVMTLPC